MKNANQLKICVESVTQKQSATTAISTAILRGTADQDVGQGPAHSIVIAEADTPVLDHQEMKGDVTTEMTGEDRQIATVNVEAMNARTATTAIVGEDVMIVAAGTVQTNGGPNTTIGDQGVGVLRRTEEEGKETALGEKVLKTVKTTEEDLIPEKQVSFTGFKAPILLLILDLF